MAQRTVVRLTDDLSGAEIPAGKGETVTFSLDGQSYEIDLTAKNAGALRTVRRSGEKRTAQRCWRRSWGRACAEPPPGRPSPALIGHRREAARRQRSAGLIKV